MKILITGASGFVGRNVKEYLEKQGKYEIYAPSSKELDCLDERGVTKYLQQHHFDYIFHFAIYGDSVDKSKEKNKILDYNLRMFLNFYKNANLFSRMYYTGSGAEYDKRYDISSVKEEELGRSIPVDSYGLLKYTIAQMIENSSNIYNLRLFGIFGKYEYYPTKFISNVCCKAIKDLPLTMRQNVYFDYLWIEDFCRMAELFLYHQPRFHTYNVVSGTKVSLKDICEDVLAISKKELPVFVCKDGLANEYTASNRRFLNEFPEFQYTPIKSAIEILYQWYQENPNIDIYQLLYS